MSGCAVTFTKAAGHANPIHPQTGLIRPPLQPSSSLQWLAVTRWGNPLKPQPKPPIRGCPTNFRFPSTLSSLEPLDNGLGAPSTM